MFDLLFIVVLEDELGPLDVHVAEIVDPELVETVGCVRQLVLVETFTDALCSQVQFHKDPFI